jgi:hypothetical protein
VARGFDLRGGWAAHHTVVFMLRMITRSLAAERKNPPRSKSGYSGKEKIPSFTSRFFPVFVLE